MTLAIMVLTTATAWAETIQLTDNTTDVTLQDGDVLTGTGGVDTHISIADGATVTLSGTNITAIPNDENHRWAGITCLGDATIILSGDNAVTAGYYSSGIYIPKNKTLTIQGDGTLNTIGGRYSAGIGSGNKGTCGDIIIMGGTINAECGDNRGAGIGSGNEASCGNITICGGNITATGAPRGAGIGSGGYGASCGDIIIKGGTITATAGEYGAGIGSGFQGSCGNIIITRTVTSVTATKGNYASYSIGVGKDGTCGTVMIGGVIGTISQSPYKYTPNGSLNSTVQFDKNGGTGEMDSWQFTYDGTWQSIPACTFTAPNDRVFAGWNTAADGSGFFYKDEQQILDISDVTLYAQWVLPRCEIYSSTKDFTLYNGQTLAGTGGAKTHITIADGATVTLSGVNITAITDDENYQWAGITCLGDATIILSGDNAVKGGYNSSGIYVPENKTLTIRGDGSINTIGKSYSAGIGCGKEASCGNIIISGGNVTATGGAGAAGIGCGGDETSCGNIIIKGGIVNTTGNYDAAGIGGAKNANCKNITISGGTITATGGAAAAGIGSGYLAFCDDITIEGGTITAIGGKNGAGIGSGLGASTHESRCGNIIIKGGTVTATGGVYAAGIGSGEEACRCGNITISGGTITATSGNSSAGIGSGKAASCGDITITAGVTRITATKRSLGDIIGSGYNGSCGYVTIATNLIDVTSGKTRTLWPGMVLIDNADNNTAISSKDGLTTDVQLRGRTFWKDGDWNTLCLPFEVSTTSGTLAGDGVVAMTLNTATSGLSGQTLTLNFTEAETIPVGTPFIIKWDESGTDIENPVFSGVSVTSADPTAVTSDDGTVSFVGTYSPISYNSANSSILFLGPANTLYYPRTGTNISAFHAYFQLNDGSAVKEFKLNFGDEDNADGIGDAVRLNDKGQMINDAWYSLDGRKLGGKPTQRGIYINNGKKVIIN